MQPSRISDEEGKILALEKEAPNQMGLPNSPAPICRLPSEILAAVFECLQQGEEKSSRSQLAWVAIDYSWENVMLVCRLFRDVAVHSPSLWSTIDYWRSNPIPRRELYLERSASAPLHVRSGTADVAHVWHRVRSAILNTFQTRTVLDKPSPLLRFLAIKVEYYDVDEEGGSTTSLSSLAHSSASLVHLGLEGSEISITDIPFMSSLTSLTLSSIRADVGLIMVARLLKQLPALEDLVLDELYLGEVFEILEPGEVVPAALQLYVPRLRTLFVRDAVAEVSLLLRSLSSSHSEIAISVIVGAKLGPNHVLIYKAWVSYCQGRANAEDLLEGSLSIDLGERHAKPRIAFGSSVGAWSLETRTGYCVMTCILLEPHPLLERITTLFMRVENKFGSQSLSGMHGLDFLPALHTLVIETIPVLQPMWMQAIKDWIISRTVKIKQVKLVGRAEDAWAFAEELKQERLADDVIWASNC